MKTCLLIILLLSSVAAFAQNTLKAYILEEESQAPLKGATVLLVGSSRGATADADGLVVLDNIPDGPHTFRFSFVGYAGQTLALTFPRPDSDPLVMLLEKKEEELEAIEITSTRSSRTIQDIPTRVEFIAGEELEEKANMKPGDIRMILNESTGIQTQQTSATSANASIRIQGLDGRYTQILKDGFPLYAGYSGGLGLLQTPPLDLKQVEVIKGAASTLYGGGAIAGLVNLISKTPQPERELRLLANGTTAGGLDINGFYGQQFGKMGLTVFGARNSNAAYDPSETGFSAIPRFSRYTLNPRLFFNPASATRISLGINGVVENRLGGDVQYIEGKRPASQAYFERNKTQRYSSQFALSHRLDHGGQVQVKNSVSFFDRRLQLPRYAFAGKQVSTFSEAHYAWRGDKAEWIGGLNLWTEQFREQAGSFLPRRDYQQTTAGAFVQHTVQARDWLELETGLRTDHVFDYGFAFLPRFSALFKLTPSFTSRLGGGMGYKAPSIFTEETERLQYQGVLPVHARLNKLERSYGGNLDLNYRTALANEAVSLSINHLFFYTYLNRPLVLAEAGNGLYQLQNSPGHLDTKGTETNVKLGYADFHLFLGYTYTDARIRDQGRERQQPLTPRHRLNTVLMYEAEEKWKLGLEAYYFGRQRLSDNTSGKPYWITGFMAERLFEKFSVYANFENFLDVRQTRFDSIYTGSLTNPVFRDIYAPLDGFVVNGGLKLRL